MTARPVTTGARDARLRALNRHPAVHALRAALHRRGVALELTAAAAAPDPRDRRTVSAWMDADTGTLMLGVTAHAYAGTVVRAGARALLLCDEPDACRLPREDAVARACREAAVETFALAFAARHTNEPRRAAGVLLRRLCARRLDGTLHPEAVLVAAAHAYSVLAALGSEDRDVFLAQYATAAPALAPPLGALAAGGWQAPADAAAAGELACRLHSVLTAA